MTVAQRRALSPGEGAIRGHERLAVQNQVVSIASPYYWLGVAALVGIVAAATRIVADDRFDLPFYRVAVVVYVLPWIALGSVFAAPLYWWSFYSSPHWPPLWTGLPLALLLGVMVVLVGGHLIALLAGARRVLLHPQRLWTVWRNKPPPPTQAHITQAERAAAETYDAEWQIEDRRRNNRLGTGPRL
jgi:hypothetical protein